MYIDSHEHEDIIEYWTGFLAHVKEYSKLMMTYDWIEMTYSSNCG